MAGTGSLVKLRNVLQQIVRDEWFDQDRNALCSNGVNDLRPDVASHDNGRDIPGKRCAQGINSINAVGRSAEIVIAYQEVWTDLLPVD